MARKISSIEYLFRDGQKFSEKSNLRSKKTGRLPDSIELVFTQTHFAELLEFFNECGYDYNGIEAVYPEYNMVSQEQYNVNNQLVRIPDALNFTFRHKDGLCHTWQINDYGISNTYEITNPTVPFVHEVGTDNEMNTKWRAYNMAKFGKEYTDKLKTEIAFEAVDTAEMQPKKAEHYKANQRKEMKQLVRLASKYRDLYPGLQSHRDEADENIKDFFENTMDK